MQLQPIDQLAISFAKDHVIGFALYQQKNYTVNWHHRIIAQKLEDVASGNIKRLMIFMPPRNGKSELASILFPAWYLGKYPDKEIITASYSSDLAKDFGAKTRDIIKDEHYRKVFNVSLKEDSQSKDKWHTDKGGSYTSVGVGGSLTGRGSHVLLIDDPIKNREEANSVTYRNKVWDWFTSTAYTRLEPGGAIILIQTRWHLDDLAGRLLEKMQDGGEQWEVVSFPAIAEQDEQHRRFGEALWKDRYTIEDLERIKKTIGLYDFNALYQQRPIASETQEFKQEWIKYFTDEELIGKDLYYYTTVDLAVSQKDTADNSSIITVAKDQFKPEWYVVDVHAGRFTPLEVIEYLFHLKVKYGYRLQKIGIETVGYQKALLYFLAEEQKRRQNYLPITELKGTAAKEQRIRGLIPLYMNGVVYHKNSYGNLEEELFSFPVGQHDDRIDSLAYQLQIIPTTQSQRSPMANRVVPYHLRIKR